MKIRYTIESQFQHNMMRSIQNLQYYEEEGESEFIIEAVKYGAFASEFGIMLISKELHVDIYQDNKINKTRKIRKIIGDVYSKLSHNGTCVASSEYLDSTVSIRYDILKKELENIVDLRNGLAHREGDFDDSEAIRDLMRVFTFINILIPYHYRINEIIEDIDLKNYFVKLTRNYSTQEYITRLRELRATNYKEAQYLPSDPEVCEICVNDSSQIFISDSNIIHFCSLCCHIKVFFTCMRCGNHIDEDEIVFEIDAEEDAYICNWCVNDYMSKN